MRRITALCLLLCLLIPGFSGCKGPFTDREAAEILAPLLEKDAQLNLYIWGDGFTTLKDPGADAEATDSCKYYRVNADAPYHSVADLRAAAEAIYSTQIMASVNEYAFENTDDQMARFCDFLQNDEVADLQIDVTANHPPYELKTVVYPSTAVVNRSTRTIIEADVQYSVGDSTDRQVMTVRLLYQSGTWKLDTHTWAGKVA